MKRQEVKAMLASWEKEYRVAPIGFRSLQTSRRRISPTARCSTSRTSPPTT